jgi:cellulose synthase operon protein YhjQ
MSKRQIETMERQGTERIAGSTNGCPIETGGTTFAEQPEDEVPEDVAILYSWANLQGAKYRDFSASRREYRAQKRSRTAEVLLEQKVRAAAEAAANTAATLAVEGGSNGRKIKTPEPGRLHSRIDGEPAGCQAVAARDEAAHRADPTALAASTELRGADHNETAMSFPTALHRSRGYRPDEPSGQRSVVKDGEPMGSSRHGKSEAIVPPAPSRIPSTSYAEYRRSSVERLLKPGPEMPRRGYSEQRFAPLEGSVGGPAVDAATSGVAGDTLQPSREPVAARWFALKGVFQRPPLERSTEPQSQRPQEMRAPILAVFSLAGGVGKTSLVATLGRALSSLGEQVLLVDTTAHGLLPFYFGASELIHGVVRNFSPPPGSKDAPIHLVGYDVDRSEEIQTSDDHRSGDVRAQDKLADLFEDSRGSHRVLLDLPATSGWVVRRVARMSPTILIPLAPDMNSVLTLQSLDQFLHAIDDAEGRPLAPYFLLNQFDPGLPLHVDVREVLRQQLGERLLPFVIHRAPAISEALAEGMTIIDYAPDSAVAQDFLNVALWIRSISAPLHAGFRKVRWSER